MRNSQGECWQFYLVDGCVTLRVRVAIFGGRNVACLCAALRVRVGIYLVGVHESQSWVHDHNLNMGYKQFDPTQ